MRLKSSDVTPHWHVYTLSGYYKTHTHSAHNGEFMYILYTYMCTPCVYTTWLSKHNNKQIAV